MFVALSVQFHKVNTWILLPICRKNIIKYMRHFIVSICRVEKNNGWVV